MRSGLFENEIVLAEGSVYERLRRDASIEFDEHLAHGALIYNRDARRALEEVHRSYAAIGQRRALPMLLLTDTWRANRERIALSRWNGSLVNRDNVAFLRAIARDIETPAAPVYVGAIIGCRGDAYAPEEALDPATAAEFHFAQLEELASAGVDVIQAATLPAVSEALGIALAMQELQELQETPYILSFVVLSNGTILDGTPLDDAIRLIDRATTHHPAGFMVNCVHPDIAAAALSTMSHHERIIGIQGNTASCAPWEIDGSEELVGADPEEFAQSIMNVAEANSLRIVGGCCGTDERHIDAIARRATERAAAAMRPGE